MIDQRLGAADDLRRQVRARLSEGRLPAIDGISKSQHGTGRPCLVCRRAIEATDVEREIQGAGIFLRAHEACYVLWREESKARPQSTQVIMEPDGGKKDRPLHVIAGKIAEIGHGYVLLTFSSAAILLTDGIADGFQPGQRVTITAVLIGGQFMAQKIELAPR